MLKSNYSRLSISILIFGIIFNVHGQSNENTHSKLNRLINRRATCPDAKMCLSKWGYCGYTDDYCGVNCVSGPCKSSGGTSGDIINETNFQCVFNTIDSATRKQRLTGLQISGYKPKNADEAAVFLSHVFHETDGLKTLVEYCAPGS